MSENQDNSGFPKPDAKLQKSAKQSAFERQKAEAEAKRKREAAETAAVYEDFVKSFDRDDDNSMGDSEARQGRGDPRAQQGMARGGRPPFGVGAPPSGGPSRRHFGQSGMKSGPGSLGPAPGGFNKKRSFQDFSKQNRDNAQGADDHRNRAQPGSTIAKAFDTSDDEEMRDAENRNEERAVAKPTLRLTNLPPGTSPATIKALMPSNLVVEQVKILPINNAALGTERKSLVAIVTMSLETPGNEMDTAVSLLQNRYMGHGHYLSLHRHLSSAVSSSAALPNLSNTSSSQPFGAKPVEQPANEAGQASQRFHRGFAPPTDYGPAHGVNRTNLLHVPVKPPQDIRTLQLINGVIEGILEHGPEFEALLMSRPEVQQDEKWAWLWDARSEGGIWLRWRLWEVVTGSGLKKTNGKYVPLFEGSNAWKTPDKALPFEYATTLEEIVSDSDYNSTDDDDFEYEGQKDGHRGDENEKMFLNPLEKAKLTHLLARLPTSISGLRKGDIARVTAFALMHSSRGADEVVDMITANVEKPLSLTRANADRPMGDNDGREDSTSDTQDVSGACLVGLYAVNDILSSSSTSGVRHAWRFRQLFETALQQRKTFEKLGLLPEKLKWGRLRVEKWKRSIGLVLNLWEGWSVFPGESHSQFVSSFEKPPSSKVDDPVDEAAAEQVQKGRWKVVDAGATETRADDTMAATDGGSDVEGEPIDDDDIEGEPIDDDDIEGEPIDDDDLLGEPMDEDGAASDAGRDEATDAGPAAADLQASKPEKGRQRMRAVDMFADSESGEE
ncbi:hypothetical protein VHEMI06812 [[Torrubiella] hemipterigena]|uniref:CID domain-containing protein n=1 Tax=[Torrubiella] hemipterigena TaxID=1531966 RepID=A0A0A1T8F6_9HYPO|nr:hypothetical protein VHEMI06812 [[Torrubiella] hemipterigena]